ncbi:MAG: energy transducer TonB [bacterium]
MSAIAAPTDIGSSDRFGLTLFLATIVHGIIILGLSFSGLQKLNQHTPKPMDIIIVQSKSNTAPEDAENIAQFNQEKSGQTDEKLTPSEPIQGMAPDSTGFALQQQRASTPARNAVVQQQKKLHTEHSETQIVTSEKSQKEQEKQVAPEKTDSRRDMDIARLTAQVEQQSRHYAERPRVHFIDALSAKSAAEAQYIQSWVQKVESIGNLNYPVQAKLKGLNGKLILNVLLDASGRVLEVHIAESSGNRLLDQSAVTIVHQSSPFPSFSAEMREQYDQLMITRTWKFNSTGR